MALTKCKGPKCSWALDLGFLDEGYSAAGIYADIKKIEELWNLEIFQILSIV